MVRDWSLVLCSICLLICGVSHAQEPLRRCADVRALSREQAAEKHTVALRGVVTYVIDGEAGGACVVQDETEGIYVGWTEEARIETGFESAAAAKPAIGMLLEVQGVTGPGGFAPVVHASAMKVVGGVGELPPAHRVTLAQLRTGTLDSQRVEISGVVQRSHRSDERLGPLRLEVATRDGRFSAFVADPHGLDPDRLVDAELRLTGVCFTFFNPRGEAVGVRLHIPGAGGVAIVKPPETDPFSAPEVAPLALLPFAQMPPSLHRQRLSGVVTLSRPDKFIYVQMPQRAVRVNTRTEEVLAPGDRVEASGFVEGTEGFAILSEALVRRTGHEPLPEAVAVTREQILAVKSLGADTLRQEDYDGVLVKLRGRLMKVESSRGEEHRVFLDCAGAVVIATLDAQVPSASLAQFADGSEVEATGICAVRLSDNWPALKLPVPEDFTLILQAPDSLRVLVPAPWWTPRRLWTALGFTAGVLLFSLAWVWTLRRRVALRSAELAQQMRARRDAAVEFEATLRERTRLAADLHDTLEQSLTGLALQLEAADALRSDAPERSSRHLHLARHLLDRSREDVRRSVWNLRANPLEGSTLADALRAVAADRSVGLAVRIAVECEGDPRPLPDFVAGNLLLLAQEGITNAVKHAAPQHITLELSFSKPAVRLAIRDDGCGFDPVAAPGPREGHFGLQGMRERAKRLGGSLRIRSEPGKGARVEVFVPLTQGADP